jgi:hypothetical protein
MAFRRKKSGGYKARSFRPRSRKSYSGGRGARSRSYGGRGMRRSSGGRSNTLRIVLEQPPAPIGRFNFLERQGLVGPDGTVPPGSESPPPQRARF